MRTGGHGPKTLCSCHRILFPCFSRNTFNFCLSSSFESSSFYLRFIECFIFSAFNLSKEFVNPFRGSWLTGHCPRRFLCRLSSPRSLRLGSRSTSSPDRDPQSLHVLRSTNRLPQSLPPLGRTRIPPAPVSCGPGLKGLRGSLEGRGHTPEARRPGSSRTGLYRRWTRTIVPRNGWVQESEPPPPVPTSRTTPPTRSTSGTARRVGRDTGPCEDVHPFSQGADGYSDPGGPDSDRAHKDLSHGLPEPLGVEETSGCLS